MADRLALDEKPGGVFVSRRPPERRHVFGGLLIGQALRAASLTVTGRPAHSLHASFLVAGTGGEPVRYEVERTRDGASFATRRVVARQRDLIVLLLTADFHSDEPGLAYEAPGPSGIPGPEGLPVGRYDSPWFESRDVPVDAAPSLPPHARRSWFRPTAPVPDDPALQLQALAYLSDHGPTRAAREPHAALADDARRMSVSLDHSVWFNGPADVNGWLLSELVPVATGRGRGLALGTIRRRDGTLLATLAQEVLLRSR
jgi:acyl-CoA thioesterase-2